MFPLGNITVEPVIITNIQIIVSLVRYTQVFVLSND